MQGNEDKYLYLYKKYKVKYLNLLEQSGYGKEEKEEKEKLLLKLKASFDEKILKKMDLNILKVLDILIDNGINKDEAYTKITDKKIKFDCELYVELFNAGVYPKFLYYEFTFNEEFMKTEIKSSKLKKIYKTLIINFCKSIDGLFIKHNIPKKIEIIYYLSEDGKDYTSVFYQIIKPLLYYINLRESDHYVFELSDKDTDTIQWFNAILGEYYFIYLNENNNIIKDKIIERILSEETFIHMFRLLQKGFILVMEYNKSKIYKFKNLVMVFNSDPKSEIYERPVSYYVNVYEKYTTAFNYFIYLWHEFLFSKYIEFFNFFRKEFDGVYDSKYTKAEKITFIDNGNELIEDTVLNNNLYKQKSILFLNIIIHLYNILKNDIIIKQNISFQDNELLQNFIYFLPLFVKKTQIPHYKYIELERYYVLLNNKPRDDYKWPSRLADMNGYSPTYLKKEFGGIIDNLNRDLDDWFKDDLILFILCIFKFDAINHNKFNPGKMTPINDFIFFIITSQKKFTPEHFSKYCKLVDIFKINGFIIFGPFFRVNRYLFQIKTDKDPTFSHLQLIIDDYDKFVKEGNPGENYSELYGMRLLNFFIKYLAKYYNNSIDYRNKELDNIIMNKEIAIYKIIPEFIKAFKDFDDTKNDIGLYDIIVNIIMELKDVDKIKLFIEKYSKNKNISQSYIEIVKDKKTADEFNKLLKDNDYFINNKNVQKKIVKMERASKNDLIGEYCKNRLIDNPSELQEKLLSFHKIDEDPFISKVCLKRMDGLYEYMLEDEDKEGLLSGEENYSGWFNKRKELTRTLERPVFTPELDSINNCELIHNLHKNKLDMKSAIKEAAMIKTSQNKIAFEFLKTGFTKIAIIFGLFNETLLNNYKDEFIKMLKSGIPEAKVISNMIEKLLDTSNTTADRLISDIRLKLSLN